MTQSEATPVSRFELATKIMADLQATPLGRFYPMGLTPRLRRFIENNLPQAEIVKHGSGELVRLRKDRP